jgi:hypothetical protein
MHDLTLIRHGSCHGRCPSSPMPNSAKPKPKTVYPWAVLIAS